MWDVLSYDFDQNILKRNVKNNDFKHITKGSIIVFHDSLKTKKNLKYALPKTIQILKNKGFTFDVIK